MNGAPRSRANDASPAPNRGRMAGLGSVHVMLLTVSSLRIQQWLLCAGALLVLIGFLFQPPTRYVFAILGLVLALAPLVFAGGMILRYFASPRVMRLIPHAREQILGGMLLVTVVIASGVTLVAWSAGAPLDWAGTLWLRVAVVASILLLTQFALVTSVPGMTLWFVSLGGVVPLFRISPMRELLLSIGSNAALMTTILIGGWILFAAWFLRVPSLKSPNETVVHGTRVMKVQASPVAAIRAFLFGNPSLRYQFSGGFFGTLIVGTLWALIAVATQGVHSVADAIAKFAGPAFTLGVYAGIGGFIVARRSKYLWLRGGIDRNELFRLCEKQAWSFFAATAASLVVLLAVAWVSNPGHGPTDLIMLLYQMGMGSCLVYLGLMHVSGWRVFDVVCTIVLALVWVMTFPILANVMERLWLLPELFGGLAAFAFILRLVAVSRWERIDWLVCRPPKLTARGLPAET